MIWRPDPPPERHLVLSSHHTGMELAALGPAIMLTDSSAYLFFWLNVSLRLSLSLSLSLSPTLSLSLALTLALTLTRWRAPTLSPRRWPRTTPRKHSSR